VFGDTINLLEFFRLILLFQPDCGLSLGETRAVALIAIFAVNW